MSLNNKKIKLQKINKYKMPVYDYPYTYKRMYSKSAFKKAIANLEKEKIKPITNEEILENFHGIKEATQEEIATYIKLRCGYKLHKWMYYLGAIFSLYIAFSDAVLYNNDDIFLKISIFILNILFALLIFSIGNEYDTISFDKRKIKKSKVYVADCYEYDFKFVKGSNGLGGNYVKIHDGNNHYINKWLKVTWYKRNKTKLLLYIFDYNDNIDIGVLTEYEIASKTDPNFDVSQIWD